MSSDPLTALVARVAEFHITDKAMAAAQMLAEAKLREGNFGDKEARAYLEAVKRYFAGFEREARVHLRDVDKRLEGLNQIVFNLTAERAVAVKRIEATQAVLGQAEVIMSSAR